MLGIQMRKKWKSVFHMPDLFTTQVLILQIGGHWPVDYSKILPTSFAHLSKHINYMVFGFVTFLNWHMAVLCIINFLITLQSDEKVAIADLSDKLMSAILHGYGGFASFYVQIYHEDCKRMLKRMNTMFRQRSSRGLTYVTIEPSHSYAREVSLLWTVMLSVGVVGVVAFPLIVGERSLILPAWYPYDEYADGWFQFTFVLQIWVQYALSFGFGDMAVVLMSCVILVCGQFDMLFCSLKNVRATAIILAGGHEQTLRKMQKKIDVTKEELNQYYFNDEQLEDLERVPMFEPIIKSTKRVSKKDTDTFHMEYYEELHECIKDCILHHQLLLEFCDEMEKFFSPVVFMKSLQITSQICNLTYLSTKLTGSVWVNLHKIDYLILTLSELFIFGYSGNWMKLQSVRVNDAIYRCPWYLCGGPFRRSIVMFMANSLRPIVLTGGGFFVLDYEKAKGILSAAFSYYTLLRKLG